MDPPAGRRARALVLLTVVAALIVWAARRPDQLLHPYAWVEEGTMIDLWQHLGVLRQVVHPINGQLILSSSLSVGVILSLDFLSFPALAYVAASVWFVVLLLLWLCPASRLPLEVRVCFVVAIALVPTNPEVTGVLEYSFWWVTLWVVPCLFWESPRWWLRGPVLLFAGLSSLAASSLFVAFALLWLVDRRRHDLVSSAILLGTCVLQTVIYFASPRKDQIVVVAGDVAQQSFANVGTYLLGWLGTAQFSYAVFVGVVAVGAAVALAAYARGRAPGFALEWTLLVVVFGAFTVLSSVPAAKLTDPYGAGPRYYLLPFIALSWLAVLLVWGPWKGVRHVAAAVLVLSLVTLAPAWSRSHEELDWRKQVLAACATGGDGKIPIHFDGVRSRMWTVTLTRDTCADVTGGT